MYVNFGFKNLVRDLKFGCKGVFFVESGGIYVLEVKFLNVKKMF